MLCLLQCMLKFRCSLPRLCPSFPSSFFFFNDTATTEIYTLSLHDALPICTCPPTGWRGRCGPRPGRPSRSEEHTSELQSHSDLVCRLLLEKKKKKKYKNLSHKKKKKKKKQKNNS